MPRAEVGSTKHLANKMKSKGLQRLRWYCQVCEKQCRDENGFKCHTQSESHVRQMILVGEDSRKHIQSYSTSFQSDFLKLLRTAHGEKQVHINHFYQEYIANKEHIHMNATKWPSLTEFAKHLGREGLCRVEDVEGKGLHVAWIDNSPEALRRQDAIRKKERQDRGDEEREQRLIKEQIERAEAERVGDEEEEGARELKRQEGEKIKLSFGKPKENGKEKPVQESPQSKAEGGSSSPKDDSTNPISPSIKSVEPSQATSATSPPPQDPKMIPPPIASSTTQPSAPVSLKLGSLSKPKNVFASSKKNALSSAKPLSKPTTTKPMSAAERIMKEEIERKRAREAGGFAGGLNAKKQRVS